MSAHKGSSAILQRRDGGVTVLTLNAPERRNALIPELREALIDVLTGLDDDTDCRAIVITGAGTCFCAGGDVSKEGPFTALQVRSMMKRPQRLARTIAGHSKPIIAAVNGPAFGAGLALAMACDFVVSSKDATFCAAYGRIGVAPDIGVLWSLPLRVGLSVARRIVMFADTIDATAAYDMGLVDWLADEGQAEMVALERAQVLASKATASITATKALMLRAPVDLETVFAHEIEVAAWISSTQDMQEGMRAFKEKRPPQFKGG